MPSRCDSERSQPIDAMQSNALSAQERRRSRSWRDVLSIGKVATTANFRATHGAWF